MSKWTKEKIGEGGSERPPMEVISTIMTASNNLSMATSALHTCVHSVYECKVVESGVEVGEVGVNLM